MSKEEITQHRQDGLKAAKNIAYEKYLENISIRDMSPDGSLHGAFASERALAIFGVIAAINKLLPRDDQNTAAGG